MKVNVKNLNDGLILFLKNKGFSVDDANIIADNMIYGTSHGYLNHGVERLFQLLEGLKYNTLSLTSSLHEIKNGFTFKIYNAEKSIGQVTGVKAINEAIEISKKLGIGMVGVINSGHLGALGYYAKIAAQKNCFGIVLSNTSPAAVIPGGKRKLLGTNPIAYSFPLKNGDYFVADFSTAAITRGEVIDCKDKNIEIPGDCAIDKEGNITTDPSKALSGGLLPYGGKIKGSLISLLIATLTGPLIGGKANNRVIGTRYMNNSSNKGDIFISIDISQFVDIGYFFDENVSFFEQAIDDVQNFHIPGTRNISKEVPISEKLYELLKNNNLL